MNRVRLGEVASVKSGFAFKSKDWQETGVPVVKIGNVKEGWIALEGCSFVNDEVATSAAAFELVPGDILISMTGHIGQVAKVRNEGRILLNQRVGRFSLRRPDQLDREFLFQWLRLPEVRAAFEGHAYGAAQPNISPTLIEQQPIPLPPIAAQRRIAAILSAYDDLIENNTRRIAILEEMARRIYEEWFVRFRFPGHENMRMVKSELGLVPEGWDIQRLGELISFQKGRKPHQVSKLPAAGLVPILLIDALRGGPLEYATPEKMLLVSESETIMVMDGSGSCEVFIGHEGAIGSTLGRYRSESAHLGAFQLYLLFSTRKDEIRAKNIGAAIPHANKDYISSIQVSVPSRNVALQFEQLVSPMFALRKVLRLKNANLRTTRDLLLPKLISGELDVSAMSEPEAAAA